MKIIIVVLTLEIGGSERRAITLARYFNNPGYKVEFWGLSGSGPLSKVCEEIGIPCVSFPLNWFRNPFILLFDLIRLAQALRKARPDILLPHTLIPNTACGLVWRWSGAKYCAGYEGGHEFGLAGKVWEKQAIKRMSGMICNANHLAIEMEWFYAADKSKIAIIPNGVDLPAARNTRDWWRRRLGVEENTLLLVKVANLSGYKNHAALLRAWRLALDRLHPDQRNAKLVIAGKNFGTEPALRKLSIELELQSNVEFLGYVDDVAGLLQAVDLGVYSSNREGCPNGVLECMQMGLSIAATDGEGMREVVGEHQIPWLSPLGDDQAFANNILALLSDPVLRKNLGMRNKERVADLYSTERMCRATENLFLEGIDRIQRYEK